MHQRLTSQAQKIKRKSPDLLYFETMSKFDSTLHSFYVNLVKVLVVPNQCCDDKGFLSVLAKSVVVFLAKSFHDNIDVDENYSSSKFESSHYSKCLHLGKVVDDMKTKRKCAI